MEFHRQSELFDLLDRLQSARLDDQRCELPTTYSTMASSSASGLSSQGSKTNSNRQVASKQMLQRMLKHPPPYPMVALVQQGTHWVEPSEEVGRARPPNRVTCTPTLEEDSAKMYRVHFGGYEHFNFCASDSAGQPLVMSLRIHGGQDENNNNSCDDDDDDDDQNRHVRVILRSSDKTVHQVMRLSDLVSSSGHSSQSRHHRRPSSAVIEAVMSQMAVPPAMPVMFPGASELITAFDEHCITNKFKFGIIYQKFGQVTEEAIFSNRTHSPAMEEFMQLLGQKVRLSEHTGYRGGLDTRHGQTGTHALFEKYLGNEIMFHVSTLLPYVDSDDQQLQRKCHIGNDIVAIVFQEVNTPFAPDMIASHFLHAYIVVQPIDPCTSITRYRVSVVAQKDVPPFGPPLPSAAIFDKGLAFKDFLLAKLVNGERACYQAAKFQTLHQRTRATLLANLAKDLREQTVDYISTSYASPAKEPSKSPSPSSSRLFTSVKRALKHVGSAKHEFQRHASSGSLSEAAVTTGMETTAMSSSGGRKNISSTSTMDESIKTTDSGHGDSDSGSLSSSPQLSSSRKKLLSTSQPHLAVLNDHHLDTSSVEADDIIYEHRRQQHHRASLQQQQRVYHNPRVRPQLSAINNDAGMAASSSPTVISGAVTTIPVGGSPTSSTASSASSPGSGASVARLYQDISRLRVDKLELLRQALSAQHEVRQLRQRESQLETDLALAAAEIRRLKLQLRPPPDVTISTEQKKLQRSVMNIPL